MDCLALVSSTLFSLGSRCLEKQDQAISQLPSVANLSPSGFQRSIQELNRDRDSMGISSDVSSQPDSRPSNESSHPQGSLYLESSNSPRPSFPSAMDLKDYSHERLPPGLSPEPSSSIPFMTHQESSSKRTSPRSTSPFEESSKSISNSSTHSPISFHADQLNFSKMSPYTIVENGNSINGASASGNIHNGNEFKVLPQPIASSSTHVDPSPTRFVPPGLAFNSSSTLLGTKSFEDITHIPREFSLVLPSFGNNSTNVATTMATGGGGLGVGVGGGVNYWTAGFQQMPASSIPEFEREIENARQEAAMLNVKLQAAIRKNQAFATGW